MISTYDLKHTHRKCLTDVLLFGKLKKKKNGTNSAEKELNHPESLALSF